MDAAEKLLERMRRTQSGYKPRDFDTIYFGFGFVYRDSGGHRIFKHTKYKHLRAVVPQHGTLKKYCAEDAVALIGRLKQLEAEDESRRNQAKSQRTE